MAPDPFIAADTDYFKSVPWCNDLIASPDLALFTPTCRLPHVNAIGANKDQFFRKTLNHAGAIPHCIGLYQDPEKARDRGTTVQQQGEKRFYIASASILCDLQPGLNGYNGTAHGGLISTLVDEAMGSLILINHLAQTALEKKGQKLPEGVLDLNNTRVVTANMTVRFQKPVPTPGIVVVAASQVKIEGRKISFDVRLRGEGGKEFAQCDGLWMSIPLQKM